jgi:hypothetical protein
MKKLKEILAHQYQLIQNYVHITSHEEQHFVMIVEL